MAIGTTVPGLRSSSSVLISYAKRPCMKVRGRFVMLTSSIALQRVQIRPAQRAATPCHGGRLVDLHPSRLERLEPAARATGFSSFSPPSTASRSLAHSLREHIIAAGGTAPTAAPARARPRPSTHSLPVSDGAGTSQKTAGIQRASPELSRNCRESSSLRMSATSSCSTATSLQPTPSNATTRNKRRQQPPLSIPRTHQTQL